MVDHVKYHENSVAREPVAHRAGTSNNPSRRAIVGPPEIGAALIIDPKRKDPT
jgi:hypothetical protein